MKGLTHLQLPALPYTTLGYPLCVLFVIYNKVAQNPAVLAM